jgi:hypothetical protein
MDGKSIFTNIFQRLQELDGAQIIIGVQAEPGENFSGGTVSSDGHMLMISKVHEYGCDISVKTKNGRKKVHIPERSYIRRAFEEGKALYCDEKRRGRSGR